ncbi:MAG: alpha/beta fold hydrolase [Gemmatimonadota bacterium]
MAKHFLLIHGLWGTGAVWNDVVAELERRGHTAEAPTLPGHSPGEDRSEVTFEDYVQTVVQALRRRPEPAVVVGHSAAGVLLQAAAPRAADKIERLVFKNAWLVPDGHAFIDIVPPEFAELNRNAAERSTDNSVPPQEEVFRNVILAGEPPEAKDAWARTMVPQPFVLMTTPVSTEEFARIDVPCTILLGRDDRAMPPGTYLKMAEVLGDYDVVEIDGGHIALMTHPEAVADGLERAVGVAASS